MVLGAPGWLPGCFIVRVLWGMAWSEQGGGRRHQGRPSAVNAITIAAAAAAAAAPRCPSFERRQDAGHRCCPAGRRGDQGRHHGWVGGGAGGSGRAGAVEQWTLAGPSAGRRKRTVRAADRRRPAGHTLAPRPAALPALPAVPAYFSDAQRQATKVRRALLAPAVGRHGRTVGRAARMQRLPAHPACPALTAGRRPRAAARHQRAFTNHACTPALPAGRGRDRGLGGAAHHQRAHRRRHRLRTRQGGGGGGAQGAHLR